MTTPLIIGGTRKRRLGVGLGGHALVRARVPRELDYPTIRANVHNARPSRADRQTDGRTNIMASCAKTFKGS